MEVMDDGRGLGGKERVVVRKMQCLGSGRRLMKSRLPLRFNRARANDGHRTGQIESR